ncbi:MAG: amidohydrolase family protein, partial [Gemmatimonadota bacterium]
MIVLGAVSVRAAGAQQALVLTGVTVIDGTGPKPRPDQAVVVLKSVRGSQVVFEWFDYMELDSPEITTEEDLRHARATWPRVLAFTKPLDDAGVLLTVGTDLSNPWIGPASNHRELQLLVDAGISPLDVLTLATRNGAKALGILDDVGRWRPAGAPISSCSEESGGGYQERPFDRVGRAGWTD